MLKFQLSENNRTALEAAAEQVQEKLRNLEAAECLLLQLKSVATSESAALSQARLTVSLDDTAGLDDIIRRRERVALAEERAAGVLAKGEEVRQPLSAAIITTANAVGQAWAPVHKELLWRVVLDLEKLYPGRAEAIVAANSIPVILVSQNFMRHPVVVGTSLGGTSRSLLQIINRLLAGLQPIPLPGHPLSDEPESQPEQQAEPAVEAVQPA